MKWNSLPKGVWTKFHSKLFDKIFFDTLPISISSFLQEELFYRRIQTMLKLGF